MRKDKRDELTILCDELEQCNKKLCIKNEIAFAKDKIREYAGNDIDKQLKLKALIDIHDEGDRMGFLNYLSILVGVFSFCSVVINNINSDLYSIYAFLMLVVIFMLCGINLRFSKKINARKKWRRYLKVVLYNMEKDEN